MSLDPTQLSGIEARLRGLRERLEDSKRRHPPTRGQYVDGVLNVWTEDGEQVLGIAERLFEELKAK